jgi:hypothetical protein
MLFHGNDRRFNAIVVALPSCAHLGPLEFLPPGTDLTTQEMPSTISLMMAIAKTFLPNPWLTSISRCILIHTVHFRNTKLASLPYVIRMPIIFSPRPCSAYNFLEVFSASNLFLG